MLSFIASNVDSFGEFYSACWLPSVVMPRASRDGKNTTARSMRITLFFCINIILPPRSRAFLLSRDARGTWERPQQQVK